MKQTRRFPKADVLRHAVRTLALMVLSVAAFAQTSPPVAAVNTAPKNKPTPILFKGTDITDFVEYSKLDVMTVTRSFKLYNWSKNGQNAQWKQIPNSHDARTLNMVKRSANGYFGQLGNPGGDENMYGYGLYTSLDPVATRSYGGYSYSYGYEKPVDPNAQQMWQLIELTTPIGFKFLDLNQAHNYSRSDVDLQPTLNAFKCTGLRSADSFFQYGAVRLAPECIALFKFVFQDTLKIDAFSYSYNTSHFLMCDKGLYAVNERSFDRERALVLTSNTWMNTQNVSVRVSIMRGEPNERRLIQSLFAYSGYAQNGGMVLDPKAAQSVIKNLLSQNPTASIQDGGTKCSGLQMSYDDLCVPEWREV